MFARFFSKHCGSGSHNKRVSSDLFNVLSFNFDYLSFCEKGYYAGDGGQSLPVKQTYTATTTSELLCDQIEFINRLNNNFLTKHTYKIPKKKKCWVLSKSNGKYFDYLETNEHYRVPVKQIEYVKQKENYVYDIEVEDEHSFFTECGEVHNCVEQTPQVLFVEFLNTWTVINSQWKKEDIAALIIKAIEIYLEGKPTSGCAFLNHDTKLCLQHTTRPYNCRMYCQVPEEDFKPRLEALKVLYKDRPGAILKDQCNLVKTCGKKPTKENAEKWWDEIKRLEMEIGIHPSLINDKEGGSYRTYHDHILLMVGSPTFLSHLTHLRNASEEQKQLFLQKIKTSIVDILKTKQHL